MLIFTSIIFAMALLLSFWSIQAYISLTADSILKRITAKRQNEKMITGFVVEAAAIICWGIFYFLTH